MCAITGFSTFVKDITRRQK